jgi:hypothetical protein
MAAPAERMRTMRERRRVKGLRELRVVVPDARSEIVRRRIFKEVAQLNALDERLALDWIEDVSEFDGDAARVQPSRTETYMLAALSTRVCGWRGRDEA